MARQEPPAYALKYLRAWRQSCFLSQAQLAKASGVSLSTVKYLESGKHPASAGSVARLASALGTTPETLISQAPEAKAPLDNANVERQSSIAG